MARGKSLNHKKKSHPGEFPKNSEMKKSKVESSGDDGYLVTKEAFKNRFPEE
ncbi:hypothetical protein [Alkalihalobacillus sp. BA299]|uniref:hypothetical protein n=1 Tax=Alkalihalobacillus sp. BA299 TaxID=2815938 RepID=UPI001ADC65DC|nr:hypothetical protein [Alkalihalobacillus sp. BA299]